MYRNILAPSENKRQSQSDANILNRINEFERRLETELVCSGGKDRKDMIIDEDIIKGAEYAVGNAELLIYEAAPSITKNDLERIKDRITNLDPIVAASLLFTMRKTSNLVLASEEFLDSAKILDNYSFSALLYMVKISEQIASSTNQTADAVFDSLTNRGIFTKEVADFFNELSVEAVSQWLYSIGMTGKVAALTSKMAMNQNVLDAIGGDSNILSKFSLAMGVTEAPEALTKQKFLESFGSLDLNTKDKLLSKMIYTRNADRFTTPEVMSRIRDGDSEVWVENARVLVVSIGDNNHNLGSVLFTQSLGDAGVAVNFLDNAKSAQVIANSAKRMGVTTIIFSIMGKGYDKSINEGELLQIVTDTSERVKAQGITVLGGGIIEQSTARTLQQAGVTMFERGKTASDAIRYMDNSALRHQQQLTYAGLDSRLIGIPANNTLGRVYAPITVSAALIGGRYAQAASYAPITSGQTSINAQTRLERSFAAATQSDQEEELKKRRRTFFSFDMNADERTHPNGINGILIRVELPKMANTDAKSGMAATSTTITRVPLIQTMVTQASGAEPLQKARKAATAPTRSEPSTFTIVPISPHPKVEVFRPRYTLTSWEAMRCVEVLTNTKTKITQTTMQMHYQNYAITAARVTTLPVMPIPLTPSLVTMRADLPNLKSTNALAVKFAGFTRPTSLVLPASRIPNPPTAEQSRFSRTRTIAWRKGLKLSTPIPLGMNIFEKAADKFRKFNAARRERNLEKLLSRSGEFADRIEAEAKRFGLDLRGLKTGNHYEALGIRYTTDHKAIKEAYHALIKKHHPDVSRTADAEEVTKRINEAYAVLKDRKLKEEYDRDFSKGKNRISASATKNISQELVRRYTEAREKDFEKFRAATSVPLQRDVLRGLIDEVCDWNKRFGRVANATFGDFRDYGKRIKGLSAANKRLMKSETGAAALGRLRENGRRLDELMLAYGEMEKGMSVITGNVRKEIGSQESTVTKRLKAMV